MLRKPKVFKKIPNHLASNEKQQEIQKFIRENKNGQELLMGDMVVSENKEFHQIFPFSGENDFVPLSCTCAHENSIAWFSEILSYMKNWQLKIETLPSDVGTQLLCGKLDNNWKKVVLHFCDNRLDRVQVHFSSLDGHLAIVFPDYEEMKTVDQINAAIWKRLGYFLETEISMLYRHDERDGPIDHLFNELIFDYKNMEYCEELDRIFEVVYPFNHGSAIEKSGKLLLDLHGTIREFEAEQLCIVHARWNVLKKFYNACKSGTCKSAEIVYVSQYDTSINLVETSNNLFSVNEVEVYFAASRRKYFRVEIQKIAFALAFLDNPYVIMWIIDELEMFSHMPTIQKYEAVASLITSVRCIYQQREQSTKTKKKDI